MKNREIIRSYYRPFPSPKTVPFWVVVAIIAAVAAVGIYLIVTRAPERPVPPGVPQLSFPTDGAQMNDPTPTFRWTPGPNAENHHLQVDNDPGFTSPELEVELGGLDNSYTPLLPLADGSYFWRVVAISEVGENSSEVWDFLIDTLPPAAPSLLWPPQGLNLNDPTPNLEWSQVPENSLPVTYLLWIDNNPDFSSPELVSETTAHEYQVPSALGEGVWYWAVGARDGAGNLGENSQRWFRVDTTPPASPTLISPAQAENIEDNTPTLDWSDVADPSAPVIYQLQVDDDPNFQSPVVSETSLTSSSYTTPELSIGEWYWRVRALDNAGNAGAWSMGSFEVVAPPPPPLPVSSLTLVAEPAIANGEDEALITAVARDIEGNPVPGLTLSYVLTVRDFETDRRYFSEIGGGVYTAGVTSTWAGTYTLLAQVEGTEVKGWTEVTFHPGPVARAVISTSAPRVDALERRITYFFTDAQGNPIPREDVEPVVQAFGGHLGEPEPLPGNFSWAVNLTPMDWGLVEVEVTDNLTGISGSVEVEFKPLVLEVNAGGKDPYFMDPENIVFTSLENLEMQVTWPENRISATIALFIPDNRGQLGMYQLVVEYDNSALWLDNENVVDADPEDGLELEVETISDNAILITGTGAWTENFGSVVTLNFKVLAPGITPIFIENLRLFNTAENQITVPPAYENSKENIKALKRLIVPLKIWIVDNFGITEAEAKADVDRAENIYNTNALACRLSYRFVFITEFNHIPKENWETIVGADNQLSWAEVDVLAERYRWERWVNIYYAPNCTLPRGALGWWRSKDNIILIDDGKDFDNRTLAHELGHEFSRSGVKDSPQDNAAAQGSRDARNLWNYNDTGDEISREQGRLMEEEIDRRAEARPQAQGGGYIYKPIPY